MRFKDFWANIFHLFLLFVLLMISLFFILFSFSEEFCEKIAFHILHTSDVFLSFGIVLFIMTGLLTLGFYYFHKKNSYKEICGKNLFEVKLSLIKSYLENIVSLEDVYFYKKKLYIRLSGDLKAESLEFIDAVFKNHLSFVEEYVILRPQK